MSELEEELKELKETMCDSRQCIYCKPSVSKHTGRRLICRRAELERLIYEEAN